MTCSSDADARKSWPLRGRPPRGHRLGPPCEGAEATEGAQFPEGFCRGDDLILTLLDFLLRLFRSSEAFWRPQTLRAGLEELRAAQQHAEAARDQRDGGARVACRAPQGAGASQWLPANLPRADCSAPLCRPKKILRLSQPDRSVTGCARGLAPCFEPCEIL